MYDIISIGSATRDVFVRSDDFKVIDDKSFSTGKAQCLGLGSKFEIKDLTFSTGGGATNAVVTFARQGLSTACISVVGDDLEGEQIIKTLQNEGVDTRYLITHFDDTEQTAFSIILVNPTGERSILSYKGEGQHLSKVDIPIEEIETKWIFISSLGGSYELLEKTINWAKNKNIKIATNPGGKELEFGWAKLESLYHDLDVVIMNQEEASGLTGIEYDKEEEIFKKLDKMISGVVVMTKGPQGVIVSDNDYIYRAGIPDSPVVERTGAGDAWSSGFISEYSKNKNMEKAIQFATANASSVVTKFGAKEGILKNGDWGEWPLVEVLKEKNI